MKIRIVLLGLLAAALAACGGETKTVIREVPASEDTTTTDSDNPDGPAAAETCIDKDGDGYGVACEKGPDCDDSDPDAHSLSMAYVDNDGDGYASAGPLQVCGGASLPTAYIATSSGYDCDDFDASAYTLRQVFFDLDGDGTGGDAVLLCASPVAIPAGYSLTGGDCSDLDEDNQTSCFTCADGDGDGHYAGCDAYTTRQGPDCNDLNGEAYQNYSAYKDSDEDTYTVGGLTEVCGGDTLPSGYSTTQNGEDCEDSNASLYQEADLYVDIDGDSYTDGAAGSACIGSNAPSGYAVTASTTPDCNDLSDTEYVNVSAYPDQDNDTYTSTLTATDVCTDGSLPEGYIAQASATLDCDDGDPDTNPGATDIGGDYLDQDCNGADAAPSATGIFVSMTNGDDGNDGSSGAPVRTVAKGLELAGGNFPVYVAAGNYYESITADTVLSGGYDESFVSRLAGASSITSPASNDPAVTVTAEGTLAGFSLDVTDGGSRVNTLENHGTLRIVNTTVRGPAANGAMGIYNLGTLYGANVTVDGIDSSSTAAGVMNSGTFSVKALHVRNIHADVYAIGFSNATNSAIAGCRVEAITSNSSVVGIYSSSPLAVDDCTVDPGAAPNVIGIDATGKVTVKGGSITVDQASTSAIGLMARDRVTVRDAVVMVDAVAANGIQVTSSGSLIARGASITAGTAGRTSLSGIYASGPITVSSSAVTATGAATLYGLRIENSEAAVSKTRIHVDDVDVGGGGAIGVNMENARTRLDGVRVTVSSNDSNTTGLNIEDASTELVGKSIVTVSNTSNWAIGVDTGGSFYSYGSIITAESTGDYAYALEQLSGPVTVSNSKLYSPQAQRWNNPVAIYGDGNIRFYASVISGGPSLDDSGTWGIWIDDGIDANVEVEASTVYAGRTNGTSIGILMGDATKLELSDSIVISGSEDGDAEGIEINHHATLSRNSIYATGDETNRGIDIDAGVVIADANYIFAADSPNRDSYGVDVDGGSSTFTNNVIVSGDTPNGTSAAIYQDSRESRVVAVNNTLVSGDADEYSIGYFWDGLQLANGIGNAMLYNNVITVDTAGWEAMAIGSEHDNGPFGIQAFNNLLWGPSGFHPVYDLQDDIPHTLVDLNNCFFGGCAASGNNLVADPVFADMDTYAISVSSPAIDRGANPSPFVDGPHVDVIGTARPQGAKLDIGAYEYVAAE